MFKDGENIFKLCSVVKQAISFGIADKYYVRTRTTSVGKLTRSLLSPQFTITAPSCVSFQYFGHGRSRGEMKTIAVTQVGKTAATTKTVRLLSFACDTLFLLFF